METERTDSNQGEIYISISDGTFVLTKQFIELCISDIIQESKLTHLDAKKIADKVYPTMKKYNKITDLHEQIIMITTEMCTEHYDYPNIATFLLIDELHRVTDDDYSETVSKMMQNLNPKAEPAPLLSKRFSDFVFENKEIINSILHKNKNRDYDISLFGYRTLEKAYLKKLSSGAIVERPQYMWMRVAISIHQRSGDFAKIEETYNLLSEGYMTHATPTLFNAGTSFEQLSSCFLLGVDDDMGKIGDCWKKCGLISKHAGGIGITMTPVRVNGAYINSTQGTASGLKVLSVFNEISRYADQSGKRPGSIAIYIEPWHGDIFFFLDLKKNTGAETERARDLFLALTINDIFMKRVESDGIWSLMCPHDCPDLLNKYGDEFTRIYENYEAEGKFLKQLPARELWFKIMESQIETGVPYMLYKDAVNSKSNQINIGVVNGSNLCVSGETMILTSQGYLNIKDNVDKVVNVWNGEEFSSVKFKKTGIDQEMMKVSFSNGCELKCTPYHKFYIMDGNKIVTKQACDLVVSDRLIKIEYPTIEKGNNDFKYPYTHGLFTADGTYNKVKTSVKQCNFKPMDGERYCKRHIEHLQIVKDGDIVNAEKCHAMSYVDHPYISLYGIKKNLLNNLEYVGNVMRDDDHDKITVRLYHDIAQKYVVPINCNIDIKLSWLAGLLDGDGTVAINGSNKSLQIGSVDKLFLNNVLYMLQTMGCDPKVTLSRSEKQTLLPDGKGGRKLYNTQTMYRLLISSNDTYKLVNMGLKTYRLNLSGMEKPNRNARHFITITELEKGPSEDTYCFTEPKKNAGVFNGVVTSQCIEIVEVSTSDEYAVCFSADTEIVTENGIKKIVDCDGEKVLSYFNNDKDLQKSEHFEVAKLIHNGRKQTFTIKTSNGKDIRATEDHPFLVADRIYQWRKLKDLRVGDELVTPTSHNSKILSIEEFAIEDVYDLVLSHSHNFIANGYVVHNCNLASICLPKFVENGEVNYPKLFDISRVATRNLNNIIDSNFYPVEEARTSNMKHRPVGLGVQGLADVFFKMKIPFDSPKAREVNKRIFETIYFGAMTESCLMAKEEGHYSTFVGSPLSQGKFQFDLWGLDRSELMWDWAPLEKDIATYGVRNSLTTAEMPTASTSQIMGNNETFEAITSNIYTRKTIAGDYYVINKYLMSDLMELGLWDTNMVDMIKYYEGSIQNIPGIPQNIKDIYRTVYEIEQRSVIDMSADRGPFVDQTQSLNLHIAEPDFKKLTSCHMHGWRKGLKTGMYYLRSKAASEATKFGIDVDTIRMIEERNGISPTEETSVDAYENIEIVPACPYNPNRKAGDGCLMCGS